MTAKSGKIDKSFLVLAIILMVAGFFIFSSASLALLAKENSNYASVTFSQTFFGLFLGTVAMVAASKVNYKFWRKAAFWLLLAAVVLNILVLFIGFEHAGAKRWIHIAGVSFQTSEVLKLAFIVYFAAWAASVKDKIKTFKKGFLPLLILFGISTVLLLLQPDTDNLVLIILAGMAMFIAAGGKWRYALVVMAIGLAGLALLVFTRPYLMQRVTTFFNPHADALGASYQVQQSLIAIGSGRVFGTGFGKGVHKYTHLPEPAGDSIFAVLGQEFGFVGCIFLLLVFVLFATRGLKIASQVPDVFARLVVVGIVIIIVAQAFVNIGAMLGVVPLSGITLPFVSQGGTSLFITLLEVGIILSISKARDFSSDRHS